MGTTHSRAPSSRSATAAHAIASRRAIDQARGIVVATHGCTSERAWASCGSRPRCSNRKLRVVAAALTANASRASSPRRKIPRTALRTALARHVR
ncbi:MAG: ANTAR domain-containing protein [Streptomyces sp.]|nr:ANTAR domain-containing protein [Streptomyces sp.]NUT28920.1 ANTAR domain-containing protein [Streptomyces sp.]